MTKTPALTAEPAGKRRHRLFFFAAAFFFCTDPIDSEAQSQFAGWAGTFHNYKISPKTGLYFDVQWRSAAQVAQTQSLLLRPGFNYYVTPRLTATAGYALIHQQRIAAGITDYLPEHRLWEQLTYTHPVNARHARHTTTLSHRLRLEQRYIPRYVAGNGQLVRQHHAPANRLRYFARAVIPLGRLNGATVEPRSSAAAFEKGWFAALQNEVFINFGDKSAVNGKVFDQNRACAAIGYRVAKPFDVELGYMNQYVSAAGNGRLISHIVQFATYVRL